MVMIVPAPPDKTEQKRISVSGRGWNRIYSRRDGVLVSMVSLSNNSSQKLYVAYRRHGTPENYDEIPAWSDYKITAPVDEIFIKRSDETVVAVVSVNVDWYSQEYMEEILKMFHEVVADAVAEGIRRAREGVSIAPESRWSRAVRRLVGRFRGGGVG